MNKHGRMPASNEIKFHCRPLENLDDSLSDLTDGSLESSNKSNSFANSQKSSSGSNKQSKKDIKRVVKRAFSGITKQNSLKSDKDNDMIPESSDESSSYDGQNGKTKKAKDKM